MSSPPALVERLELLPRICIFSYLPKWISLLSKLRILKIGVRELVRNDIDVLMGLRALTDLSLHVHTKPTEIIFFGGIGFKALKYLKINCCVAWLKFDMDAMPSLYKLKLGYNVDGVDQERTIPDGIQDLYGLKEISVKIGGADPEKYDRRAEELAFMIDSGLHDRCVSVTLQFVRQIFDFNEDKSSLTQEEQRKLKQQEILEDDSDEEYDEIIQDSGEQEVKQSALSEWDIVHLLRNKLDNQQDGTTCHFPVVASYYVDTCQLTALATIRPHLAKDIPAIKGFLIVIDDLWATSTWDIIKCALPEGNKSSRILTTTEIEDLALQSCSYDLKFIFKMIPFGEDDSRKLLFSIVFGSHSKCPPEVSETLYDIVRKCGGLPLAIVTVASLLASQLDKLEQWDYINKSLGYSLMANPTLEGMKQLLNLCYSNLPQHLKACMLYLSMYQGDHIIWKDDLVNQWIAEGFICATEEHDKEEISRGYFDELVGRKIIQPVHIDDSGEVLSCVVHHIVLNFVTYKSIEENFIIAIDHSQATIRFADKDSTGIVDLTKISELVRLRYLKVTSNATVKLPTRLQGLQYLETLKIDGKISEVPSDIIHLPGLLHLTLPAKTNLPTGISHVTSLRTIGYFDLSCNSVENLWRLGELTNLWDLQLTYSEIHSDNLKNNMKYLGPILGKLRNLKSITLSADGSSCPDTLHIDRDTKTRINLGNLCILKIGIREVTSNNIDVLGVLPELTVLSLYVHTKPAERIVFDNAGFSILRYFKFICSVAWMKFEVGAMPSLRKLKLGFDVHRADQHDIIPVGIEHLSGLEEISAKIRVASTAHDHCRRFAESALTNAIRMHPGRPSVNIRCVDWTFDGMDVSNAGTREEECRILKKQQNIVKESSTEKSAVLEKDRGDGANKSDESREKLPMEMWHVRSNTEDDGLSWSKYEQKEILGAKFPRAYFRCTHWNTKKGCMATKEVQRDDGDPLMFDIVYHGEHSCAQTAESNVDEQIRLTRTLDKKVKRMKRKRQVRVTSVPADDGYSWRKYGQKNVLGFSYLRGYYRCAHRNTKGCQAKKQVQRHDDGLLFDVTYLGEHTCADQPQAAHSSDQVQVTLWPPAVSPEQPLTPQSGLEQSSTVTSVKTTDTAWTEKMLPPGPTLGQGDGTGPLAAEGPQLYASSIHSHKNSQANNAITDL
ncbi:hypothetical protein OsI_36961 [Oryza sativa Indica Group]|uniref:WRKY domain-containing protein n=1 Tax=Oryza sativa subsp. indica TaxID=39946 RepID=A2ZGQ4_ORYSI|nr:hypothetical protein OsI_36961 [Oryza sativa Indica Group]